MASKPRSPSDTNQQEEMTVVILRFAGSGPSLQKGFDAVGQALAMLGQPALPRASARQRVLQSPTAAASTEDEGDTIDAEIEEVIEPLETEPANSGSPRKKYTPKFLSDLDLKAGDIPFKEYCDQKNPKTENEKYLTAAAWLTKHGGVSTFSVGHVFTCFRTMQWKQQTDFSQPMRKLKADKSYFDTPKRNEWKLTPLGLDQAELINNPRE